MTGVAGAGDTGGGAGALGGPAVPEWAGTFEEPVKTLVGAKGWKTPADAVKSYAELERTFGADKAGRAVILPAKDDDAEGWGQVWAKLGRPEKPEGYELDKLEGADPDFAKEMAAALHAEGVPARQAKGIAKRYQEAGKRALDRVEQSFVRDTERDMEGLKKEWGPEFSAKEEIARRAVRAFLKPALESLVKEPDKRAATQMQWLQGIERTMGTRGLYTLFHAIGAGLGEDRLAAAGASGGEATTREAALAELEVAKLDEELKNAWFDNQHPKHKETAARLDRLYQLAYDAPKS